MNSLMDYFVSDGDEFSGDGDDFEIRSILIETEVDDLRAVVVIDVGTIVRCQNAACSVKAAQAT